MSCPNPETAAAWLLAELPEAAAETFAEHYFECTPCWERMQRLERTLKVFADGLPFTLTPLRHQLLSARGNFPSVEVQPGKRATLHLSAAEPQACWIMRFAGPPVARVDLEASTLDGQRLFGLADVAYDAEHGCVYMPCQIHYQHAYPGQSLLVIRLSSPDAAGGERELGRYFLDHQFDSA